jgi:ATP-dependent Clp protease protease subunit
MNIPLVGSIRDELVANTVKQLITYDGDEEITLMICSDGGDTVGAIAIYEAMRLCKVPVNTHVIGWAASAAVLIAIGGHRRYAGKNTTFFLHGGRLGDTDGNIPTLESALNHLKITGKLYQGILVRHTKFTASDHDKLINNIRERFILPDEALELGFIDEIK